jgi:indolepyruvate ferredoxin oxidoreductase alpha subunit
MENGTTAMTGHQDHAGNGGKGKSDKQGIAIRSVLEGLGAGFIKEVDTYKQKELTEAVKEALEVQGFSVVIARHPCMLKFSRENRKKGIKQKRHADIDPVKCDNIQTCISSFGCPSFTADPGNGRVTVNAELCIGDGSCVQTCPVSAIGLDEEVIDEN